MADKHKSVKSAYHAAGIHLIVSAFGSTNVPTSTGADPKFTALKLVKYVSQYNLDSVDVDYEDFNAFNKGDGSAEKWIIVFTIALHSALLVGAILTHAHKYSIWQISIYIKYHYSRRPMV